MPRWLAVLGTIVLLAGTYLAFGVMHESTGGFAQSYLTSLLGSLITAGLIWALLGQRDASRERLLDRKAAQVDRVTDALLAARAAPLDDDATRRLHEELHRSARYLSDETLAMLSRHVRDAVDEPDRDEALLELMLQFRSELGLAADVDTPSVRALREALHALAMQREAIAQIAATAKQLFGALRKIAADEESEWTFVEPQEREGASVIGFATTDGLLEGHLALPYPPEPHPRVEATLEVRTAPFNLVLRGRQKELRKALRKLGYGRPKGDADAVDPHDRFSLGVVFDHPDEPYLTRANNLVDLLDDTRDAIDGALA